LEDAKEVDVMGKHDDLSTLNLIYQSTRDIRPPAMIQRRHRIIEHNSSEPFAKLHFCEERCDGNGPLLTFA
jgi:hypothetical protein